MRKTMLFPVAGALILAGIAGWAATNTQARVVTLAGHEIDPLQIMVSAKGLPVSRYKDLSLVFD